MTCSNKSRHTARKTIPMSKLKLTTDPRPCLRLGVLVLVIMDARTGPKFCWPKSVRVGIPDRFYFWSGPVVRNSGSIFIGQVRRSGIPDQRTGPKRFGPEFRTNGPDKKCRSGFPDQRTGPKSFGPEFRTSGPDRTNYGLAVRASMLVIPEHYRSKHMLTRKG